MVADHVPLAELNVEPRPVEVHDHVPDPVAGAAGFCNSVPANEHVTFAPPRPPGAKLAMPRFGSSVPVPAPGKVAVMFPPETVNPSDPPIGAGHTPVANSVPVKLPAYEPSRGGGVAAMKEVSV
jgi:hypothetical protein